MTKDEWDVARTSFANEAWALMEVLKSRQIKSTACCLSNQVRVLEDCVNLGRQRIEKRGSEDTRSNKHLVKQGCAVAPMIDRNAFLCHSSSERIRPRVSRRREPAPIRVLGDTSGLDPQLR